MDYSQLEAKMQKAIDFLRDEFSDIRAGRANPAILNKIDVEYYGVLTPITQVGTISVPEARQILINPWDKGLLGAVEKAIQKADIGVNPMNDGNSIRLTFPELNEERRKELTKEIKNLGEESKIAIRNTRREYIDIAKAKQKASEMSEDELKSSEEKIQKITDKFTNLVDEIVMNKEKEIMEI